jgi:hypothetical protein
MGCSGPCRCDQAQWAVQGAYPSCHGRIKHDHVEAGIYLEGIAYKHMAVISICTTMQSALDVCCAGCFLRSPKPVFPPKQPQVVGGPET